MGSVAQSDEQSEKRRLRMEPCGHQNLYGGGTRWGAGSNKKRWLFCGVVQGLSPEVGLPGINSWMPHFLAV